MKGYDPNHFFATHICEVKLMSWQFQRTLIVELGGNCKGADVIKSAIGLAVEKVQTEIDERGEFVLKNQSDGLLGIQDQDEAEIENMIVSVVLTKVVKEKK